MFDGEPLYDFSMIEEDPMKIYDISDDEDRKKKIPWKI